MTLLTVLNGLSKRKVSFGNRYDIIRLLPSFVEPEFRSVYVSYRLVTTHCKYWFPWKADHIEESWDITATLRLKDGQVFSVRRFLNLKHPHSIEIVALEVVRQATVAKLQHCETRLTG
jgi:hypothetical protein